MNNAFDKLSKLKVGALFVEQGGGKTKIALDLMVSKKEKVDYFLWICPCSLKSEIESERLKWHTNFYFDVVGCETLSQSDKTYVEVLNKVKSNKKVFMVVDESLKIKNTSAKRTRRIILLGDYAEYKLILNGTPISKNIADLWAQMEFLSPKILNMNYHDFCITYCLYAEKKIGLNKTKTILVGQKNVDHLTKLIKPYVFESKLDLNLQKNYHSIYYRMNETEAAAYEDIKDKILGEMSISELRDFDFYRLITTLQHHYVQSRMREEVLTDLLNEIDDKVIVFVKYLSSIPDGALRITGEEKERKRIIDQFREGNDRILYITYGCGAYGLNLQFCHNIIFAEHGFDYATRIQAEARIFRIGQDYDVNYYNLECDCGLENMFLSCINNKSNFLYELKREIEKLGIVNVFQKL